MDWRVRVKRAHEDLYLRVHALLLLCRVADNGEGSNTLPVKTLRNVSGLIWNLTRRDVMPCSWRNSEPKQTNDPGSGSI